MLKQYLNKGISTPLALVLILVLASIVGAFTLWQYSEMKKEETNLPEVKIPDKTTVLEKEGTSTEGTKETEETSCKEKLPQFADFLIVEEFKGSPTLPDFSSNPQMVEFVTRITEGVRRGPNFAGHFTIVEWGCGTECQSGVVVDAKTGAIYFLPISSFGRDFRINSNLLIINPPEAIPWHFLQSPPGWLYTEYYKWENNKFMLICKLKPGWKTYKNQEYGFEIKYPDIFIPIEEYHNTVVLFQPKEKYACNITIKLFEGTIEAYEKSLESDPLTEILSKRDIVINNYNGREIRSSTHEMGLIDICVLLSHNSKIYRICGCEESDIEVVFKQMLSTFRFLE